MRVDVFHISHRLLKSIRGLIGTANRSGMHLAITGARTVLLLKVFQHSA